MTLCIAWIRQQDENQELVFATDSMLTGGGETWKHGVKLFELPRKDCLLCFAGETSKAYPLVLNLVSSVKFDQKMLNQHTDLHEVLDYLCNSFTVLINELVDERRAARDNPRTAARFIFGGWNWKLQLFEFWEIYYGEEENKFLFKGYSSEVSRPYLMIGDHIEEAESYFLEELRNRNKQIIGELDMEPLLVLSRMARDTDNYRSIDGALQIAKVYQSGSSEFFGVMWQSIKGKHTFLGRELNPYVKPQIRFIDPDSGEILDLELPTNISKLNPELSATIKKDDFGNEKEFIDKCYPDGKLKADLSEKEKEMLFAIFKDNSYKTFISALDAEENEIGQENHE